MSINRSTNVRSGVIPKNTKTNRGRKNAVCMLAAHVPNVPMRKTKLQKRNPSAMTKDVTQKMVK
jgi:hypothetical protein